MVDVNIPLWKACVLVPQAYLQREHTLFSPFFFNVCSRHWHFTCTFSVIFRNFIRHMMVKEPSERYTAGQALQVNNRVYSTLTSIVSGMYVCNPKLYGREAAVLCCSAPPSSMVTRCVSHNRRTIYEVFVYFFLSRLLLLKLPPCASYDHVHTITFCFFQSQRYVPQHRWIKKQQVVQPRALPGIRSVFSPKRLDKVDHDRIVASMKNFASYSKASGDGFCCTHHRLRWSGGAKCTMHDERRK